MPIGFPSQEPCIICACKPTSIEPRFGYAVCKAHEDVPPAQIDAARAEWIWADWVVNGGASTNS